MNLPKKLITPIFIFVFGAIFIWYISSNWSSFQEIEIISPLSLLATAVFICTSIFCQGRVLDKVLEPHNVRLTGLETFGLSSVTRFGNYVSTGYLGTAIRALFLKRTYKIPISRFSAGFLLSNILYLICSGVIAVSIFFFSLDSQTDMLPIYIVLVAIVILLVVLSLPLEKVENRLTSTSRKRPRKLQRNLSVGLGEYRNLRTNPKVLFAMIGWTLGLLLSSTLGLSMLYNAIGVDIPLLSLVFISMVSGWSIIFSITPANIGVNEGLLVLGAQIMGVPLPATITVGLLKQFITFITVATLSTYFAPKLLKVSVFDIGKIRRKDAVT